MESIFLLIKGFFMGVANVIPGVSGGTIAIILGIYERFISAISNIKKNFSENIKFLLPIIIGMGISIVSTSKVVGYSYDNFPLPTILFFVGLVCGGIPMLIGKVKNKKENKELCSYMIFLFTFLLVIFMASYKFIFSINGEISFEGMNLFNYIVLFVVGIIAAATMVIPGVSGSLVLMILGYYYPIIATINNLFKGNFINSAIVLGIFGIGVLVGIVLISKLLELLFKKYNVKTYFGVLGFVFASVVAIPLSACIELGTINMSLDQIVISLILLMVGTVISYKLGDK
jgi:putative membrane protein